MCKLQCTFILQLFVVFSGKLQKYIADASKRLDLISSTSFLTDLLRISATLTLFRPFRLYVRLCRYILICARFHKR